MRHKRILIIAAVIAALVGAYALAGFVWIPRLAKQQVAEYFSAELGRKAELAEARFNPFTFEFEARGFAAPDADGTRMLGFERLYVDFELSSIWHRAWTFREIDLVRPYGKVVQRADGKINLLDLVPAEPAAPTPPPPEPAGLPSLRIGRLAVTEGHADVEDRMRARPFTAALRPITFELVNFVTTASGNSFGLNAGSDRAGRLALKGTFALEPLRSQGSLSLTGIPATTISEYLEGQLDIQLLAGTIGLNLGYDFSTAGQPFKLDLNVAEVAVRGLKTLASGHTVAWEIPAIDVRDTRVDVARKHVDVGPLIVRDAVAPMWLDATGLNFPGVAPALASAAVEAARTSGALGATPAASAAPETPAAPAPATTSRPAEWTVAVPDIAVLNARYQFEDRTFTPATSLDLTVRELRVHGFALPTIEPVKVELAGESGAGGSLKVQGDVSLEPLWAEVDLAVDALNLLPFQSYVTRGTDLLFVAGTLTASGHAKYEDATPEARIRYAGDVSIDGLQTKDRPLGEDFVKWGSVNIRGIEATTAPLAFRISEVIAREPYVKLVIAANGITNVQAVLDPEGTKRQLAEMQAEQQAAGQKPEGKAKKEVDRQKSGAKGAKAPPAPAKAAAVPPAIPGSIGVVRIRNGSANFSDYTVRPNFSTGIVELNGTIRGLSSAPTARADVDLKGKVDKYAPVVITGKVNYFAAESYTDVQASFRNIELTSFNPYAFKFAGYKIDKGKLSVETSYQVEDRKLNATHRIVVDQFEFGERIESPDAIHLPLKLAVALLKDSKGVIDLELPIAGTVDDPMFRIGPIIWKVLVNVLTKAVTAPFALLGSLFGGGDELQFIDFAPGSAELNEAARQKVGSLQKALTERPAIKLDIPSPVVPATDAPVIAGQRWLEMLRTEQHRQRAARKQPTDGLTDTFLTDRAEYVRLLDGLYLGKFGARPDIPKPGKPAEGQPPVDRTEHAIAFLEPGLKALAAANPADLEDLGKRRAAAVQDALLKDSGIDPARVFVIGGETPSLKDGNVRMTLAIK